MWYYSGLVRSEKISFSPAGCGGIVVGGICPAAFGLWGWDGRLSDRIMDFVCDPLFFIASAFFALPECRHGEGVDAHGSGIGRDDLWVRTIVWLVRLGAFALPADRIFFYPGALFGIFSDGIAGRFVLLFIGVSRSAKECR